MNSFSLNKDNQRTRCKLEGGKRKENAVVERERERESAHDLWPGTREHREESEEQGGDYILKINKAQL